MKKYALLALALLAGSCSLPTPDIRARMVDGAVVFEAFRPSVWPWSKDEVATVRTTRLSVFSKQGVVWLIERDSSPRCAAQGIPPPLFPLTYGKVPDCYVARVAAAPLVPGTYYRAEAGDFDYASGVFRLTLNVENPDEGAVGNALTDWPPASDPDVAYPPPENGAFAPPADTNVSSSNTVIETPPE